MTAKVGLVAQVLGMAGVVTTARELPLVRLLLDELDPRCATGVVWLTDAATSPTDLVATDSEFVVRIAADGCVLEPGVLYLVPAHCCAWFEGPSIRIGSRSEVEAGAVDHFLSSMSSAWGPRSVAVVPRIDGAADGEEGLARVSRAHGIAVGPAAFALLRAAGTARKPPLKECADWEPIRQFQARFNWAATPVQSPSIARLFLLHPLSLDARAACSAAIWNAKEGGRIKVWLPGCRTGELIYAMAMLLAEATLRRGGARLRLQIFGTDTDETALAFARAARYPVGAALGMDPELRGRYTFDADETIRISEQLRQLCVFSRHDLCRDAPLSGMDIVVCDRVLEGLDSRSREAAIDALHFSLKAGGLLYSLEQATAFPVDRFAPAGPGYLRACVPPAKQRAPVRMPPPSIIPIRRRKRPTRARTGIGALEPAKGNGDVVLKSERLRATHRALRDSEMVLRAANDSLRAASARREQEFVALMRMHAKLEAFMHSVGVPLVFCDEALRVQVMSEEACTAFALTPKDLGATLAELLPRVPGGSDLLDAARHMALGGETLELTVRKDQSVYLVRLSGSKFQGIGLAFTDVSALESAKVQAFAQRDQQAIIARLGALASDETRQANLFEAALGILFGTLQVCSFGLILEATGRGGRNLEVVAARGFGAEPLQDLCPPGEAARLLEAVSDGEFAVFQSTLSFARYGLACPIVNEGMM
jgi:PAS domain-containing protein